ncbi:MAG: undecaprenyl/decaprenyl-phosphate alpha-N-acetylglucosaminyl 1-phosphate transferase [Erysipelotrichaceae bacterium]|nr:undecaprenyl/decaprenyl-phosphate alpha-N-acetylglucosaminyl 1-phosphate transferase [Erysipelotrichaceae bacterium]
MEYRRLFLMVFVTFLFVALFMPIIKKIAIHIGALDIPNKRKVHKVPIPRLGGLGIYAGFLLGYMLFGWESIQMNAILIGSFIIVITGIIDDIKPIPARYKLIGQIIAAMVIPLYSGILLRDISAFGIYINFGCFSTIATIVFIVAIMNCINFIDGLDGLAGGISAIYFLMIGIIAILFNNSSGLDTILSFIMLGATLGFLVHNFYPASIFMGDSGSLFLGYIIAVISLLGYKNVTFTSLIVPIFLLAIPIMDTLFAIIRRLLKHESIAMPDKCHLHHQLLKLNFSIRKSVLIIYLIDVLFAIASIIYVIGDSKHGIFIYVLLFIVVVVLIWKTDIISDKKIERKFLFFHKKSK